MHERDLLPRIRMVVTRVHGMAVEAQPDDRRLMESFLLDTLEKDPLFRATGKTAVYVSADRAERCGFPEVADFVRSLEQTAGRLRSCLTIDHGDTYVCGVKVHLHLTSA